MAELWNALKADVGVSSGKERAALIGTGVLMAAHQVGMEAALGTSAGLVLDAVHNPLVAPLAVGTIMAGLSRTVEEGVTHVTSYGVSKFKNLSEVMEDRRSLDAAQEAVLAELSNSNEPKKSERISESIQRISIITGLGSSGIILRERAINPSRTHEDDIQTGRKAARLLMKVNFGIGLIVAGGTKLVDQTGLSATEAVASVATSPFTYAGLFVVGRVLGFHSHLKKKNARKQLASDVNILDDK